MLLELRQALRALRRSPLFTIMAILALALGIGANTAVFSVVHSVLLTPLPYAEPDRLVRIFETQPAAGGTRGNVSPGSFVDWRSRSRTLERIALFFQQDRLLSFGDELELVKGTSVSPSLFPMLGVQAVVGRVFRPEELQTPPYGDTGILISYGIWQRHFGGRSDIVGQSVRAEDGDPITIVGVMPPGFDFPNKTEVWSNEVWLTGVGRVVRQFRYYEAIGQIARGSTLADARAEMTRIAAQLASEQPASNGGWTVRLDRLDENIIGNARLLLLVLFGVVGCVLLIACANVANLMLARATARRHEVALRAALGAGRSRLMRQWLTESGLLALLGAVGGIALGYSATRLLVLFAPASVPRLDEIRFRGPVLLFCLLAVLLTALTTGIAPAIQAARLDLQDALKRGGRSTDVASTRLREWLIGGQVALTLVLVIGAILLLRSFVALRGVDLGFTAENVVTTELRVPSGRFVESRPWFRLAQHYDQAIARLSELPGVQSVGGITALPLTGEGYSGNVWRKDAPGAEGRRPPTSATDQWRVDVRFVTPRYFETMRIPLLRGRMFTDADRFSEEQMTNPAFPKKPGVALINEAMAKRFWPGQDPIGQSIVAFDDVTFTSSREIIGVVSDVRSEGVADAAAPAVFMPVAQHAGFRLTLALRASVPAATMIPIVRDQLRGFDPQIHITSLQQLDQVVSHAVSGPRFNLVLVGSFALLALVVAAIGIYGIIGYLVTRRTREIGIRVALGAQRSQVARLVLIDGLRPLMTGAVIGTVVALAAARTARGLLFGVPPADPFSFLIALALLGIAGCVAALLPAYRATRLDPLTALRQE